MTYAEIFEREARWISGPALLSGIVRYLRGRHLLCERSSNIHTAVNIAVPLPTVRNELSGEDVSVAGMVPPELREVFWACLGDALDEYVGDDGRRRIAAFRDRKLTQATVAELQSCLLQIEEERRARAEGELWWYVAKHFGLSTNPVAHMAWTYA
jgi:hypothetical protein